MTQDTADRALLIKKLLNKAEAKGTTEAERDAFNAKAAALMLQWGIEEALIADADRTKTEQIIQRYVETDVPKSYSYDATIIGIRVAEALGCRGFFIQATRNGRTNLTVVGFESDVLRVVELYRSLLLQCTLALAVDYAAIPDTRWFMFNVAPGTARFQWKRSFIRGFAVAVGTKLQAVREQVISETPGTDLVLVARVEHVDQYIQDEMKIGTSGRARRYQPSGSDAGAAAGRRANVGGSQVSNTTGHGQIGG